MRCTGEASVMKVTMHVMSAIEDCAGIAIRRTDVSSGRVPPMGYALSRPQH
jgi:hypothetical protein